MSIEVILNALPKYRKSGDKYRAPCPVHDGKDFNLMLSERSDGSVGAYCFVCGSTGLAVVDALSVDRKELFPPESDYQRPVITREMQTTYAQDQMIIAMCNAKPYDSLSLSDKRRLKLAKARVEGIEELMARAG